MHMVRGSSKKSFFVSFCFMQPPRCFFVLRYTRNYIVGLTKATYLSRMFYYTPLYDHNLSVASVNPTSRVLSTSMLRGYNPTKYSIYQISSKSVQRFSICVIDRPTDMASVTRVHFMHNVGTKRHNRREIQALEEL
jgi:hypothetical protein